ncbi:hypothetical protein CEA02_18765 [Salmonella enterica]|nr:hypothetical protein [Salmonella enterica]
MIGGNEISFLNSIVMLGLWGCYKLFLNKRFTILMKAVLCCYFNNPALFFDGMGIKTLEKLYK